MNLYQKFINDFYIFSTFLRYFLFSLIVFIIINISSFVLFNVINLIVDYGISIKLALNFFILSIPEMIFYSIPMASLLGSLLSISELNKNNEIIIMLLSGRNKFYIFRSLIIFSFFLFIITFLFNNIIVARSNYILNKNIINIQNRYNYSFYKENLTYKLVKEGVLKKSIYIGKIIDNIIENIFIEDIENNKVVKIISSEKAFLNKNFIVLKNGQIIYFNKQNIYKIKFESYKFFLDKVIKKNIFEKKEPREMTYFELKEFINNIKNTGNNYYKYEIELYQKISIPFSIIVFILIGISIGSANKKAKLNDFAFSIIFIFVYYILMFVSSILGSFGYLNTFSSAWIPNIIIIFIILAMIKLL